MKPAPFDYHRPASVDAALELAAALGGDSAFLAGGQSLVPMMNLRFAQPAHIVDLNGVAELAGIRRENGRVRIGAMTRHCALERSEELGRTVPLLPAVMPYVGYAAIRSRGTIGGSLAHADPSAELPCAAVALGAQVVLASTGGSRTLPADDFFVGPFMTELQDGELLTEVVVPAAGDVAWGFAEYARGQGEFALALAAVVLELENGCCRSARVAVGGVGATPARVTAAEAVLAEAAPSATLAAEAGAAAAETVDAVGDAHASEVYRRRLAGVVVRRAVEQAVSQ